MKPLLYLFLSFIALPLIAAESNPPTQGSGSVSATVPAPQARDVLEKKADDPARSSRDLPRTEEASKLVSMDWRENMLISVPASICADETWHRQCFNVRESQCLSATSEVVNQCIDYVTAQNSQSERDPSQMFDQTRVCAITLYERRFARRFKFVQQCTDRSRW